MLGYAVFGVAMTRISGLPRLAGFLVAVGGPAHLLGFGLAQLVSTALWPVAVLGAVSLGAGLGWPGFRLWRTGAAAHECRLRRPWGEHEIGVMPTSVVRIGEHIPRSAAERPAAGTRGIGTGCSRRGADCRR